MSSKEWRSRKDYCNINIEIPRTLKDAIKQQSETEGRLLRAVVIDALNEYIEKHKIKG